MRYCDSSLLPTIRTLIATDSIGWALREYAYTAPDAVRAFLDRVELSPLSVREASKHL